jgi:hypothetical protein
MTSARKPLVFTKHAEDAVSQRELKRDWIEDAVYAPQWAAADPVHRSVIRRYRAIAAHGDRILRVVCLETDAEIRILTAFFDRRARKPE